MKKLNVSWIILIGFCLITLIGGLFYLIYRVYINYIYKRRRPWFEIISLKRNKSERKIASDSLIVLPRVSLLPLVQEYLPHATKSSRKRRKMITRLRFVSPPLFNRNLEQEWEEMETRSVNSLRLKSTHSLYHTTEDRCTCEESITDQASLAKYFSITSSDELLTPPSSLEHLPIENLSQNQSAFSMLFNSLANLSKRLRKKEESFGEKNLNPNHTVLDIESVELINRSKYVSHP